MSERKLTRTADTQSVPSGAKLLQRSEFSIRHAIAVVDALDQEYPHPVVFHLYSGTLKTLDTAIERGHFFSINSAMLLSKKGRTIVERIPTDRALTESDGPFINVSERTIVPADVHNVELALGHIWGAAPPAVRSIVADNFRRLVKPLKMPNDIDEQ